MPTFKLISAAVFALALIALTSTQIFAALPQDASRGEISTHHALTSVTQPHQTVRTAHGDDWDTHYLDRNVNTGIKSIVTEYSNPALHQGCHAQADHRVVPAQLVLAVSQH